MVMTVGKYLVRRLEETGLRHVFGIPGDYILDFFDLLVASKLRIIGTCTELGAGFAADAYARVNGLGAVCVTYCVGGLNVINAVACACAEKSPLVVISGAPGLGQRRRSPLLHHAVRDYRTQLQIYEKVTVAAVAVEDPAAAPAQIDDCLAACRRHKRPVYIELPSDIVNLPCAPPRRRAEAVLKSDTRTLAEAVEEATAMLKGARRLVVLGGIEIHRYGLQNHLIRLVEKTGIPVAATLLGKSIISERLPEYIGVYEGAIGREKVRRTVESADCILILGAMMTDIDLGLFTANLDASRTINATSESVIIKHHQYNNILLRDFISELTRALTKGPAAIKSSRRGGTTAPRKKAFKPRPGKPCTIRRLFQLLDEYLDDNTIVISDIGDSLFGAADLTIHERTEFISPAFYTSMGFAIPAAVGAQIARCRLRPLVIVGDGAFQMTGMELSTVARNGLNPVVLVLNNKGYTTERFIREGPYNDIHEWAYHKVPRILRKGWGCEVRTETELEAALFAARAYQRSYSIINIHLGKFDHSQALDRLGKRLGSAKR
jgi:indolepyruvate decarboxylase